ncbi:MAG: ABC transporter permease [Ktedonobacterales bacterium]
MSTIASLYRANIREFVRDRAALFWTFAFPLIFIILFGLIYGNSGTVSYNLVVVDHDNTASSQRLAEAFKAAPFFNIKNESQQTATAGVKDGTVDILIVIPSGFGARLGTRSPATVQMVYGGSSAETNSQIESQLVQQVLTEFNQSVAPYTPPAALQIQSVTAYNLNAVSYLAPGIMAMALMQLGLFATVAPLVTLRQEQVLRRLGATPLPRWQLLVSQVLFRLTIGLIQCAIILGISITFFNVRIVGNLVELTGLVILGAVMFISLGYLIASLARTVESANGISQAINFPMLFLSGIFFPLAVLPAFLTPIVRALPLTYLGDAFRQVAVGSVPQFPLMVDVLVMAGWALVCSLLAARFFKWE